MLWDDRAHLGVEDVCGAPAAWAGRVAERAAECALEVVDVMCIPSAGASMAPSHPSRAERDRGFRIFTKLAEFAARAGSTGVTTLPGPSWPDDGAALARSAAELRRRHAAASAFGLALSIEPSHGSVCREPADAVRLCDSVPGLQLTLDYSHFIAAGFAAEDVEPLVPRARHVHARGARAGRLQVARGENAIAHARMLDQLRAAGYVGSVAVEYFVAPDPSLSVDVLSETVWLRDELRAALRNEAGR
jgi:sugar phosphate isomerase/epimerase